MSIVVILRLLWTMARVSRRWMMPAKYYTKVFDHKGTTIRVIFLDTTPLIDSYRKASEKYPDACKRDAEAQLSWLDETLKNAKEDWVIVVGHHPIYAYTEKKESERLDMQKRLLPILHKYNNVAIYACGHIHNFQHIQKKGDNIDYVVNLLFISGSSCEAYRWHCVLQSSRWFLCIYSR